jgi:hypothetical protein
MKWEDVPYGETFSTEEHAVTDLLRALCEPGYPGELAGQSSAVAAFTAAKEKTLLIEKSPRRPLRTTARGAKLAAAAVVGSLVMGGVAAAAVTGSLPGPLQDVAHKLGAPTASADPADSDSADPSESGGPTAAGSGDPTASGAHGNGPSVFAVCWYVVHKTDGAAGGPGGVQLPTAAPSAPPADGTDPSDALDHGDGAWSQAYARIKATAGGAGLSVLDYCTTQVVAAGKGGKAASHTPAAGKGNGTSPHGNGNGGSQGNGNGKNKPTPTASSTKTHGNGNGGSNGNGNGNAGGNGTGG